MQLSRSGQERSLVETIIILILVAAAAIALFLIVRGILTRGLA